MKLTKETADFMDFRLETFNERLKEISNIVTGRNTELAAYISDEDGKISDERIEHFVSNLIEGLVNYNQQLYSHLLYKLSDETRELYECFLYCTIQGVAHMKYVDILQHTEVERVTTFSDILDILNNSFTYRDRSELLYIEQLGYPVATGDTGFFRCCDVAYEILTDSNIMNVFSDEEAEIVTEMREKQRSMEVYDDPDDEDNDDDYEKQFAREQLSQAPPLTDEELFNRFYGIHDEYEEQISDYEQEKWEKVTASHNAWKSTVVDPDKFIARYMRYRELYFTINHTKMRDDIEKMIDIFLYEQGLSAFSLDERYGMITYRTERYRNAISSEIRKARCK